MKYDYHCEDCSLTYEVERSIKEDALTECVLCGSKDFEQVLSAPPTIFNGKGFPGNDLKNSK